MLSNFSELYEEIVNAGYEIDENLLAAVVLGLSAEENIVVGAKHMTAVEKLLRLIASNILRTNIAVVNCTSETTWTSLSRDMTSSGAIPQIVVFKNLDNSPLHLQASLLGSLAQGTILVNHIIHSLPTFFLGIGLVQPTSLSKLNKHLKERFLLWHIYDGEREREQGQDHSLHSSKSIITNDYFKYMKSQLNNITIMIDVKRYMQDIVIFLRTHRLVRGGISSKACKDLDTMVRGLTVMHNLPYATPSIVKMAARKVFPLKIEICEPTDEPTLHYGGDVKLITKYMQKWDQNMIIENVLEKVEPPV